MDLLLLMSAVAYWMDIPFCCTASLTIATSCCISFDAYLRATPFWPMARDTMALSLWRLSITYFRLIPFCCTATLTTSTSAFMFSAAYLRLYPFCFTACNTISLSPFLSLSKSFKQLPSLFKLLIRFFLCSLSSFAYVFSNSSSKSNIFF